MTPLAHRIVKELTLPIKDRTFKDRCGLLQRMDDVHCFDATNVLPLVEELGLSLRKWGSDARTSFLPAPRTWIEFAAPEGDRAGALLIEREYGADVFTASSWRGADEGSFFLPLGELGRSAVRGAILAGFQDYRAGFHHADNLLAALAVINSPRLIGRKQHMPHRGLERKLANAKALVGKFPLHAWTELKLSVSDIGKRADGTEYEAHLTGEKCLHFCRAHLRIRNGKLERVSAHWRGNPALGIKQTRYKLAA